LPALLLFGLFLVYPFFYGVYISFHQWDGFSPKKFIGFGNYVRALRDTLFRDAVWHNILYAFGSVTGKMILSLTIALLLHHVIKGTTFFRAVFFVPVVLSYMTVGALWTRIYDPILGFIDTFLIRIRIITEPILWLADPKLAIWSLVIVDIWKWTGYQAVLFLAGLSTIPDELYESASIDGANWWDKFAGITLPQLRSISLMNLTISLMGAFSVFDLVYVMTKGGPYNSTNVMLTYMYNKTFSSSNTNFGFGSAIAILLFIVILVITMIQTYMMNKED
jgi:ABC-type sugar transport system permease subunit